MSRELTYATVCSGIECCSVAARGLPLRPVFFSEIEPFPCAVLKAHYPDVPNLGDMSRIQVSNEGKEITNGSVRIVLDRRIDMLAGGTPCQSVSVAGKGEGMREGSGTRSSLAFDFVRLARELRPRWVLWENVANVLSAKHAGDFLHFLANLGDCGYSLAWRVLDAQYVTCADIHAPDSRVDVPLARAVPQRRRRVWVVGVRTVGHLGADESRAAEILFEPDCVAGHTPPRRIAGQGFAYSLGGRDSVHAGMVGGAPGTCEGRGGGKAGGGCLNPLDPQSKRIFTDSGVMQMLYAQAESTGQDSAGVCIALDGDKLKPRTDPDAGGNGFGINEDGAGYTLTGVDRHGVAYAADGGEVAATITRQIAEQSGQDNRANAVIHCAMAQNTRDEVRVVGDGNIAGALAAQPGMKQQTYVVSSQGLDGYNQSLTGDCAPTLRLCKSDADHVPSIISTNSNGENVAPTLDHNTGSTNGINAQNDKRGGYVVTKCSARFYPQENRGEISCQDEVSSTLKPGTAPGFHNGVVVKLK